MTRLLNRRGLEEKLLPEWHGLCARRENMTFITFDMDHLKEINDTYGHQAGDFAIRAMGAALRAAAPKDALTARMGGDEFLTVLTGADKRTAEMYIRRFEKELNAINVKEKRSFPVEASSGICYVKLDELMSLEHCIRLSDEEMYRVKEARHAARK